MWVNTKMDIRGMRPCTCKIVFLKYGYGSYSGVRLSFRTQYLFPTHSTEGISTEYG